MSANRIPLLPKLNGEHFAKRIATDPIQIREQQYIREEHAPIRRRKKLNRQNYTLYKCSPDRRCFTNTEQNIDIKCEENVDHEQYDKKVKRNENQLHITDMRERKQQQKKSRNQIFKIKTNFMTLETNFQKIRNKFQRSQDLVKSRSPSKILKFRAILKLEQDCLREATRSHHSNTFFNIQCLQRVTNKQNNLSVSDQGSGKLNISEKIKKEKRKPPIYRYFKAKKLQSQRKLKQQIVGWNIQNSTNQQIGQFYFPNQ